MLTLVERRVVPVVFPDEEPELLRVFTVVPDLLVSLLPFPEELLFTSRLTVVDELRLDVPVVVLPRSFASDR